MTTTVCVRLWIRLGQSQSYLPTYGVENRQPRRTHPASGFAGHNQVSKDIYPPFFSVIFQNNDSRLRSVQFFRIDVHLGHFEHLEHLRDNRHHVIG